MKPFHHLVSTTSRPVVRFAAEAGIALDFQVVDLFTGEQDRPECASINPSRQVPVLEDGDFRLTESSAIAEVLVISPRQVMINGLANGETSVIIWDSDGNYTMNTLVVGDQLQDQVMLEITVAEINRTAAERHGVDVRALGGQFGTITNFGNAAPLSGSFPPKQGERAFPFVLDGGISWAVVDFKNDIAVFFKQLQEENIGRVLAEPKLLARSGKEANFLSGGEIPIVITQDQNTSIEFKEFGTKIKFVPEVREDGTIDLKVQSGTTRTVASATAEAAAAKGRSEDMPVYARRRSALNWLARRRASGRTE